jgi:hypothetical protein
MNIINLRMCVFNEHFDGLIGWHDFKFGIWPVMNKTLHALIEGYLYGDLLMCESVDFRETIEHLTGKRFEEVMELINER